MVSGETGYQSVCKEPVMLDRQSFEWVRIWAYKQRCYSQSLAPRVDGLIFGIGAGEKL